MVQSGFADFIMLQVGVPIVVLAGVVVRAARHRGRNVLLMGFHFIMYVIAGAVKILFQRDSQGEPGVRHG